jgi:hypothetical protein
MTMNAIAELITRSKVGLSRWTNGATGYRQAERLSLDVRQWLTNVEAKFGVQGKGAAVMRGLNEPHTGAPFFVCPL